MPLDICVVTLCDFWRGVMLMDSGNLSRMSRRVTLTSNHPESERTEGRRGIQAGWPRAVGRRVSLPKRAD